MYTLVNEVTQGAPSSIQRLIASSGKSLEDLYLHNKQMKESSWKIILHERNNFFTESDDNNYSGKYYDRGHFYVVCVRSTKLTSSYNLAQCS